MFLLLVKLPRRAIIPAKAVKAFPLQVFSISRYIISQLGDYVAIQELFETVFEGLCLAQGLCSSVCFLNRGQLCIKPT